MRQATWNCASFRGSAAGRVTSPPGPLSRGEGEPRRRGAESSGSPSPQERGLGGEVIRLPALLFLLACLPLLAHAQAAVPGAASVAPAAGVAPIEAIRNQQPATSNQQLETRNQQPETPWTLVRTLALPGAGAASLDRRGSLYVTDRDNNLRQLGAEGQPLNTYSPPQPGHVSLLEAWNQNSVLAFYDDRQQVLLFDRFLAPLSEIRLADYVDGTVRTATLAPDGLLWLLDESTLTLREFDPQALRVVQSTPLDLLIGRGARPDFRYLRQYQNNVYLVDRASGVFVFDNLGNYRKKLPFAGLDNVAFRGDELVFLQGGQLHYFHLYRLAERTRPLPPGLDAATVRQVLLGDELTYFVTPAGVQIYK